MRRQSLFRPLRPICRAKADGAGGGVGLDVADADVPAADPQRLGDALAFAGENDPGLAAGFLDDFDIRPGYAAAPAGAEDLQYGLLGREAASQVLEVPFGAGGAVLLLGRCENAVEEVLAVELDQLPDAGRLHDVDPMAEDGHGIEGMGWRGKGEVPPD
jgi:hypothetical protein